MPLNGIPNPYLINRAISNIQSEKHNKILSVKGNVIYIYDENDVMRIYHRTIEGIVVHTNTSRVDKGSITNILNTESWVENTCRYDNDNYGGIFNK